jgi:undecaprenyl diphosphate synthase
MCSQPRHNARDGLPGHVAIIMDGNGRWAELRGLPRIAGHREGAESVRDIVRASRQIGISALTLYAFSSQNWARPWQEVKALMELLRDYLVGERDEIMENGIRLAAIGELGRLPAMVRGPLDALCAESAGNREMVLTLALSYGGRESIVAAAAAAAQRVARGELAPEALDEDCLQAHLPTAGLPPLDLLIRTSGERRISNFLLWEAAYSEFYFTEALWPDFRRGDLYAALDDYLRRERRFGLTSGQVGAGPPAVTASDIVEPGCGEPGRGERAPECTQDAVQSAGTVQAPGVD